MRRSRRRVRGSLEEAPARIVVDPYEVREGTVVAFDAHVGLGAIALEGSSEVPFHCIVVDDGSRSVRVGQRVLVRVAPSFRGASEATWVHKLD